MHTDLDTKPNEYKKYIFRKILFMIISFISLIILFLLSLSLGAVKIAWQDLMHAFFTGEVTRKIGLIIYQIRIPRILTAIIAGAGLAITGAVIQAVLKNPLGSPFTLGISNAAAFGAAFSVMILGSGTMHSTAGDAVRIINHYLTTGVSFTFCIFVSIIIILISRIKHGSPEIMVLAGVAMGSLFTTGTMFLQFFADDTQLAAMVFWTFGDTARANWKEIIFMAIIVGSSLIYFIFYSWNYNAINSGDETARSLGINVEVFRILTMLIASLVTAVIISFLGIIGFIGLVCPHMVRRVIGDDHRFLLPGTAICGALLLLAADLLSRTILLPHVLPVAIFTVFLGAPVFLYLLIKGYRK